MFPTPGVSDPCFPAPVGVSQEMELRDQERLTLRAQGQEFAEERQRTEEELASARRALEDERRARMAELNAACQSLSDAHTQLVAAGRGCIL